MASLIVRSNLFPSKCPSRLRSRHACQNPRPRGVPQAQRHASTTSDSTAPRGAGRLKAIAYGTALAASLCVTYAYLTDTRAAAHRWLLPPLLRMLYIDAEDAHQAGTSSLKTLYALNLHPRERSLGSRPSKQSLATTVFDTALINPIGISAGLDKHADIPDALFALGASIVEVGGCTPFPQEGNPRPRVFRVPSLGGMVNRYGLNSYGADEMARNLRERVRLHARKLGLTERGVLDGEAGVPPGSLLPGRLLLIQIAKSKETDERDVEAVKRDYVYCVRRLAPYADVLVVNVSSPNTPGLRDLQAMGPLTKLLSAVVDEVARTRRITKPKVMVKVSPDEDEDKQMQGIARAVWMSGVDGVIVGNTTNRRTGLVPPGVPLTPADQWALLEQGGYSGPAMFQRTLDMVQRYRRTLDAEGLYHGGNSAALIDIPEDRKDRKVIFATGGVTNGQQALEVLNAGASVAMVYTALVYGGPGTVTRIKDEMRRG